MILFYMLAVLSGWGGAEGQARPSAQATSIGAEPNQHFAELSWKAPKTSPELPVTHYDVYRTPAKKVRGGKIVCTNDYKQIASVDAPSTAYKDTSVSAGQAYCYRVTANNAKGKGLPSVSITAHIPEP